MMTNVVEQDTTDVLSAKLARDREEEQDVIVGIKTAHYEKPDWISVDRAVEAGRLAEPPLWSISASSFPGALTGSW